MKIAIYNKTLNTFFLEDYPYKYSKIAKDNFVKGAYKVNKIEFVEWVKALKKYKEEDDYVILVEMSTSDGAGSYDTPGAFGTLPDAKIEMLGYKKTNTSKLNTENTMESKFIKLAKQKFQITESVLTEEVNVPEIMAELKTITVQTVADLASAKKHLNSAIKLKNKLGTDNKAFNPSTKQRLSTIQKSIQALERLIKELQS